MSCFDVGVVASYDQHRHTTQIAGVNGATQTLFTGKVTTKITFRPHGVGELVTLETDDKPLGEFLVEAYRNGSRLGFTHEFGVLHHANYAEGNSAKIRAGMALHVYLERDGA